MSEDRDEEFSEREDRTPEAEAPVEAEAKAESEANDSASRAADEIASKMASDLLPQAKKPEPRYSGGYTPGSYSWRGGSRTADYDYPDYGIPYGSDREYGQGRLFDDEGRYTPSSTYRHGSKPMAKTWERDGDSLDDLPAFSRKGRTSDPSLPYWIRTNVDSIKATLERAGGGKRPLRGDEVNQLVTYIMLALGDLMEKAGGLSWRTKAMDAVKAALKANMDSLLITVKGQTTGLLRGDVADDLKYTGPVAEQVLIDALRSRGLGEKDAFAVADYLRSEGIRLMSTEDEEEEAFNREWDEGVERENREWTRKQATYLPGHVDPDDGIPTPEPVREKVQLPKTMPVAVGKAPVRSAIGRTMEQEVAAQGREVTPTSAASDAEHGQQIGGSIFDDGDGEEEEGFFSPPPKR